MLANFRYNLSAVISQWPGVYFPLERLRRRRVDNLVHAATEITIEGFPRSGTSFACRCFQQANPAVRLAHHKHAVAQIVASARRCLPTLVVVRDPEAAVRSLLVRRPELDPDVAIQGWLRFHATLGRWRGRLLIVTFDEVTQDFGMVTRRLNERFGTGFLAFQHDATHVAQLFAEMERDNAAAYGHLRSTHVPRPDRDRDRAKAGIDLSQIQLDVRRAREIYADLIGGRPA